MTKFSFYFLTLLSAIDKLSCHPIFLGPKYKNSKFCDFLDLYSINQLVNNFGVKIINFQNLAFNGLITIPCSKATKHVIVTFSSWSKPAFSHVSKLISQFNTLTSQRRQYIYNLHHEIISKKKGRRFWSSKYLMKNCISI